MEFIGFVKRLNTNAVRDLEVTVPAGTLLRFNNHPMESIRIVDAQNTKMEGQVAQNVLERWKAMGGPNVSFSGEKSGAGREDIKVKGGILVNGTVAHKILFNATFGDDKAALFEEQGEFFVLSNPMLIFQAKDNSIVMVDINDIPEITGGAVQVLLLENLKEQKGQPSRDEIFGEIFGTKL